MRLEWNHKYGKWQTLDLHFSASKFWCLSHMSNWLTLIRSVLRNVKINKKYSSRESFTDGNEGEKLNIKRTTHQYNIVWNEPSTAGHKLPFTNCYFFVILILYNFHQRTTKRIFLMNNPLRELTKTANVFINSAFFNSPQNRPESMFFNEN